MWLWNHQRSLEDNTKKKVSGSFSKGTEKKYDEGSSEMGNTYHHVCSRDNSVLWVSNFSVENHFFQGKHLEYLWLYQVLLVIFPFPPQKKSNKNMNKFINRWMDTPNAVYNVLYKQNVVYVHKEKP